MSDSGHRLRLMTEDAGRALRSWLQMPLAHGTPRSEMRHVHVVAHTHWDREWWDTVAGYRPKLIETVERVLDLLDNQPGFASFTFDGQVAPIDDYLDTLQPAERRQAEERIRRLAASGRLQLGPWYTLSDQMLVSGETTLRNLELGIARARELGSVMLIAHCPDQFGLTAELPKLLRHVGIDRVVAQRGLRPGSPPRFRWLARDGSEVDVVALVDGYFQPHPSARRMRLLGRRAGGRPSLLLAGSDQSLPSAALVRAAEATGARMSSLSEYWDELGSGAGTPVRTGEIRDAGRFCLLPNVTSNRVDQRLAVASAERGLERYAEPLSSLFLSGQPSDALSRAWKLQIWNAAHDSACATVVDPVAREVMERALTVQRSAAEIAEAGLAALAARLAHPGDYVWNPSSFERDLVVGSGAARRIATAVPPLGWARLGPPAAAPTVAGPALPPMRITDQRDRGDTYTVDTRGHERDIALAPTTETRRGEAFTRLHVRIDNSSDSHRVRLLIRLPEKATTSIADSAFGHVERPAVPDPVQGRDRNNGAPASRFILAGGLAIMVDRAAEYEILPETNELAITLLRANRALSVRNPRHRLGGAGPAIATEATQVHGVTDWNLAVMPWSADQGLPWQQWECFALPGMEFSATGGGSLPDRGTPLTTAPAGVLSAVLPDRIRTFEPAAGHRLIEQPLTLKHVTGRPARSL